MSTKGKVRGTGDADLRELRELFSYDTQQWQDIRDAGAEDMRAVSGDPWDPEDRRQREDANRPCLSLDELSQYVNQVINELRANKRAVKFAPVGNGANDDTASFYGDKMREIEYRSRAQIAYITAAENAIQRSYGFVRVSTRYEHARSMNQDIWVDAVHDPDAVTPDPEAVMPDLSDMTRCWVRQPFEPDEFARRFPKAEFKSVTNDMMRDAPNWVTERRIYVAEQWKVKTKKRKLLIVQPAAPAQPQSMLGLRPPQTPEPIGIFEDEIEKGQPLPGELKTSREVDDKTVCQYLTNGIEILSEITHPGIYIPIVGCLGKVLWVDGKRQILSMVRLARDPYMLYCYYRTCEAELVGMTPKFPYFVYEGQISATELTNLQKSLHEPVAVVQVKPTVEGAPQGGILPHPSRQPYEPPIQALEVGAEAARRAIQAAIGQSPLPTSAQRRNEKSGVALKHIEETGQRGSFHFGDHYNDMIHHVGVIAEDLMDKIYDSARDVGIRKPNDSAEVIRINDPSKQNSVSTKGDHLVTVSTGPTFDSERDAASDFADTLAQISPEIFALMGPLIVKLKNLGPIGDEMVELLETIQPPPVQAMRQSKAEQGGKLDPAAMAQQLTQAKAKLQQLEAMATQMKQALDQDAAKQQATVEKAKIDAQTQIQIQEMRNAATIRVAEIAAAVKGYQLEAEHAGEHEALALGHAHETHENELARQHAAVMSQVGHDQAMEQGDVAHQQNMEAGEQGADLAMTQAEHAAEIAPPEQAGA
jgi:hypothetical protein